MRIRTLASTLATATLVLGVTACSGNESSPQAGDATPDSASTSPPESAATSEPTETASSDSPTTEAPTTESTTSAPPPGPPMTSCRRVVHVGESTSEGLNSSAYLPNRKDRLPAQFHQVGVKDVQTDISGARSIVEKWHNQPNAQDAVMARTSKGYHGCWSIAMGTNEAANRAAGSAYDAKERINLLMGEIGDAPVLWLTVKTLLHDGYYDDANMRKFNQALLAACDRYPNLRVYNWRAEVRDKWFISDGIHFTSDGYRERAHRIAQAMAQAFPKGADPSSSCVVSSGVDDLR